MDLQSDPGALLLDTRNEFRDLFLGRNELPQMFVLLDF
jgi:hypothetical protein